MHKDRAGIRPIPELDRREAVLQAAKASLVRGSYVEAQRLLQESKALGIIVAARLRNRRQERDTAV